MTKDPNTQWRSDPQAQSAALALVLALLGSVSPNFRCVALSGQPDHWTLHFTLATDNAADRAEIEEVITEFMALQPNHAQIEREIEINPAPRLHLPADRWIAFRRKE